MRIFNDTHMAQKTLRGKQAGFFVKNCAQELIRAAKALHENIPLSVVHHLNRLIY